VSRRAGLSKRTAGSGGSAVACRLPAVTLLADLDAFLQEHRRCGAMEAAVESDRI